LKSPRRQALLILEVLLLFALAISWFIIVGGTRQFEIAGLMLTAAGLVGAGVGISQGYNTFREAVLAKLREIHATDEYVDSARLLWTIERHDKSLNPYKVTRTIVEILEHESPSVARKMDQARRIHTQFWYRAALLCRYHILSYAQIVENFGPPTIIGVLEPLEAILAERHGQSLRSKPRAWPPLELLLKSLKQDSSAEEWIGARKELPARKVLYQESHG
jgi:hypothetical protein